MTQCHSWAVIGAGPAGILAISKLLAAGERDLLWIDPSFEVGDLGLKWGCVSSNTTVKLFKDFLAELGHVDLVPEEHPIYDLPSQETCLLSEVVGPLKVATQQLVNQVSTQSLIVNQLKHAQNQWYIQFADGSGTQAAKVILATGATPHYLTKTSDEKLIPLESALDPKLLGNYQPDNKKIALFGSSHSAMIILKNLVELKTKQVINFYLSPCRYAVPMDSWILFDNTGLKGKTAEWTRAYVDGTPPENVKRVFSSEENTHQWLPQCDHVIYATGFQARRDIDIEGVNPAEYNPHTGIIAPGLFGFGIAFPELVTDPMGNQEYSVGLWKFYKYLHKVLPIWHQYPA